MNKVAPIGRTYHRHACECGFGVCAGDAACRETHCPGHPGKRASLTSDVYLLNTGVPQQPAKAINPLQRECSPTGCTHDCSEGRSCPARNTAINGEFDPWHLSTTAAVLLVLACIALAPEIAGLLTALNH